ncbi:MAG: peptidoglycan DD-metalloendopeptidase family protein [Anaerobiospirillum sp.]|nr:peptidoglycan DD-metalloendopeptidase family protein [Anaerobiospirillum sp.]
MQTEDFIYQDDLALSKYPLSKKHVIAIVGTAAIACSLYFVLPQPQVVSTAPTEDFTYGAVSDENYGTYEGMLDPTRSLTDILLTDEAEYPVDVPLDGSLEQEVYTAQAGAFENYDEVDVTADLTLSDELAFDEQLAESEPADLPPVWLAEEIQRGDTLSSIFSDLNIPYSVTMAIANNETVGNSLTNLIPGNKLYFCFDDNNNLTSFVKQINGDEQWRFERKDGPNLDFTVTREPVGTNVYLAGPDGTIKPLLDEDNLPAYKQRGRLVVAEIGAGESFSVAAHDAGLTYNEIRQITDLFSGRVLFTKQIQPGDSVRVLFSEDKGNGKINAIELKLRKVGTLTAFRNLTDDRFYDENGYNTSTKTFRRFPIDGKVIISSHFNPNRKHPVTGKVRPHNGTDFAVRVGTPIVSPADGIVEIAKYSRSAGYYIVMRHHNSYSTVYMHLSKLLVKPGQRVKIGQTIARSGNTGISTGPHLHYELRRNGRAVNAMRVTLPANEDVAVAKKNRARFDANVAVFKKELYENELVAKVASEPDETATAQSDTSAKTTAQTEVADTSTVDEVAEVVSGGQQHVTAAAH